MSRRCGRRPPPSGTAPNLPGGPGRVKGKASICGLIVGLLVGLGACAPPGFRPETPMGHGPVVREFSGLQIAVESEAWTASPRTIGNHVLPLLVTLTNTGELPVTIARQDFALLDEGNRQSLPLPPAEVVALLGGSGSGVGISPSIGIAGSSAGRTVFGGGLGVIFGASGGDARDIIPLALAEGPVLPGAGVRGFLYFPRPAPGVQEVRLIAVLRDLPGAPRLEFPFRRAR